MLEREAPSRDRILVGSEVGKVIAAVVAVGKWESRGLGGISKRSGKPAFGFPRSVFSTAFFAVAWLECAVMMAARYFDLIREMKHNPYNHRLRLVESAKE